MFFGRETRRAAKGAGGRETRGVAHEDTPDFSWGAGPAEKQFHR